MLGYILKDEAKDSWPGLYTDTIPFFKEFNNKLNHIQFLKLKKCWAKTYGNMANYAVTQFFSIFIHVCLQLHKTTKQQ